MNEPPTSPKKRRLLVVDDEKDLRILMEKILVARGYEVVTAADGREAIELLKTGRFDAALLDIMMPNENGMTVLRHITAEYPSMKTIMVTAYADLANAMEAKREGASEYITKPYKFEMVLDTLERILTG